MNTPQDLTPNTLTYDLLLYRISQHEIGSIMIVLDYEWNKELYERVIKEGYILKMIGSGLVTYKFLVVKRPSKVFEEKFIDSYFI